MDGATPWTWLLAAAAAVALFALGARAGRQNRPLFREVRAHRSLTPRVLWDTLRIWSPLGLVIVALWFGARLAHQAGAQWLYRHTTLDEFCRAGERIVPCTGLRGVLAVDAVRPLGLAQDIALQLRARYAAAQARLLRMPSSELRLLVSDRRALAEATSPFTVLELRPPPAPDPRLVRLFARRQAILANPLRRFMPADAELAGLDAQIRRLLAQVRQRESGEYQRNMLRIALRDGFRAPDPAPADVDGAGARRALVRALARSEADAVAALADEASAAQAAQILPLLHGAPHCTVEADGQNTGWFRCFQADADIAMASLGFRESLRQSMRRWAVQSSVAAHQQLAALDREAVAGTLGAHEAADRAGALVPASIDLGRQPCRPWRPANCVMNQAAASLETALADTRNRAVAHAETLADEGISRSGLSAQDRIDDARLAVDDEIAALHDGAQAGLERVFAWLDFTALLGWIALGFIVVKSLLYVLALELFHKDSRLAIAFDTPAHAEGRIEQGPMVVIDKAFPEPLVTKKQMGNSNSALQLLAWPRAAPLVRLLRRKYLFFNRGSVLAAGGADAPGMVVTAEGPLSVVAWHLQPGEEVVFDYRHFHGASANVTLHDELSLRLATLLLGRWRYHYVRAGDTPGLLLLKARVQHLDQRLATAIPRARLVAYSRHLRFKADSQRHPWRSLVNDFTLVRSVEPGRPAGLWVTAPEQAELGTFGRLLALLKSVLSAMF